jgi:hypothetical protein
VAGLLVSDEMKWMMNKAIVAYFRGTVSELEENY